MSRIRILSIDGGGMRGIIPATILQYVEEQLIQKTGNPNTRLADYFDFIAGTSTGGLLTCFYLTPGKGITSRFKAEEALNFYLNHGYNIFNKSKKGLVYWGLNGVRYSPKYIESLLNETFGNLKLSELTRPCIVTSYNMAEDKAVFFNSKEDKGLVKDFYVKDIARSTSAAPTYFPPALIKNLPNTKTLYNLDGGVFANNPTMCAYSECRGKTINGKICSGANDMIILSIGTGAKIDLSGFQRSSRWGLIKWAKRTPNIMMDGSIDTVAYQMNEIYQTLIEDNKDNYLRLDVPPKARTEYSTNMADASPKNLKDLKKAAHIALENAINPKPDESGRTPLGLNEFIKRL